jgi:multidrug transporter EmrE-like cation transporter
MLYLLISWTVVAVSSAHLLLRKGLVSIGHLPSTSGEFIPYFLSVFTNVYCISAVLLILLAVPAWILAIARVQLSFVYPFAALSYIIVALFSMLLFKEDVGVLRWLGIIVICAGVFLVSRS